MGPFYFYKILYHHQYRPGVGNTVRVGKVVGTTRKVPTIVSSTRLVMMAMVKMVNISKGIRSHPPLPNHSQTGSRQTSKQLSPSYNSYKVFLLLSDW